MVTMGMPGMASAGELLAERVFAAGSLRDAFVRIIAAYKANTGVAFDALYGPSGKLREQIQRGDVPAVFASASIEHTDALVKAGILRQSLVLARNRLCVLAAPGVTLESAHLVDMLLDPAVRVGTSTPGADPSGDYTWEFFRNVGKVRPGAFAALDAKAVKLSGRDVDPQNQDASLKWVRIPDDLNVGAVYGIGATISASPGGAGFVPFAVGPQGRAILAEFGFDGP